MAGESASVDIFGNELKLTGSERALVRGKDTVCLRKEVFVEGKKEQEPRVIIVTNAICHVLVTVKGVLKVETSFHFLKIQRIESAGEKAISFQIAGEKFPREYKAKNDNDLLDIVSTIAGQLRNTLPLTPYQELIPLSLQPPSRQKKIDVDSLRLKDNMTSPDVHSVDGFVTVYAFLCELHGVPFREDVAWNISEIYLSHGFRVLKLNDFEQQNQKQLLPLVSSLEHNEYFEGIEQKENELSPDLVNALANVLQNQYRHGFKKLTLNNVGLKRDATLKLVNAVKMNPKSSLTHLDLSENRLDDLCMEALCQMLSGLPHGLSALELNDCAITPRGCVMLASSLKENKHMAVTLSTLNLSGNNFGPDCQGALSFLAEPNAVATLKLARCGIAFEVIFPVLCRGCSQSLAVMDLSDNNKVPKKGKAPTPPVQKIKQFFTTAIAVQTVNMSHCSLTLEVAKAIFEGLRDNPNLSNVSLDISSNELSQGSPKTVAEVLSHLSCIHELNISHNNLNGGVPVIVKALVSSSVKSLTLGGNFGRSKNPMESLTPLCEVLSSKTCSFEILRLTDSKLKENTVPLLEALLSNRSLVELDVSGNDMGDRGARALSRALMVNVKLRSVTWDDNGTTLEGLKSIAEALKYNHTMRSMPAPLRDALKISKDRHKERHLEEVLQEIQSYLYRNHSPERLSVESAARRQRQILLLTAQQQELDRSIVDLDDVVSSVPENARTKVLAEEAKKIREEANKVMTVASQLFSAGQETRQSEAVIEQLRSVSATLQRKLFEEHVQESSEKMVSGTLKSFPLLLSSEEHQKRLEGLVVGDMVEGFLEAEIVNRAGPEVANKISHFNLQVSTKVTKILVEVTLTALGEITKRLEEHLPPTPDSQRKSEGSGTMKKREFSFSAKAKPTKYAGKFKDDPDEIDFSAASELPTGPKLEHVTKTRPKAPRKHRASRRILDETDGPGSRDSPISPAPTSPPVGNGDSKLTDKDTKVQTPPRSPSKEPKNTKVQTPPKSPTKEPKSPRKASKRESKVPNEGERSSPDGRRKTGLMSRFSKKKGEPQEAKEDKSDSKKKDSKYSGKESPKEKNSKPSSPTKEEPKEEKETEEEKPEELAPPNTPPPPVKEKPKPAGPKVPLLPTGANLGADVIAQMKRRQTADSRVKTPDASKETETKTDKMESPSGETQDNKNDLKEKEPSPEEVKKTADAPKEEMKKNGSLPKEEDKKAEKKDLEVKEDSKEEEVTKEELSKDETSTKEEPPTEGTDGSKPVKEEPKEENSKVEADEESPEPKEEPKEEPKQEPKEEPKEEPKQEPKAEPTEKPSEEPSKEEPKEEPKKEPPNEEPKKQPPKEEPKKEPPRVEPKKESPKVEPKKQPPKEEPKKDPPKEEPKKEPPKVEPKKQLPKVEPKKQLPKEEPKKDPPKEEPKKQLPKVEPKKQLPKVEPKKQPPKEEPKKEPPKEEPKKELPKVEPKKQPPKEEPKKEPPKEEPKKEPPKKESKEAPVAAVGMKEQPKEKEAEKEVPEVSGKAPPKDVKVEDKRKSDIERSQSPKVSPKPSPIVAKKPVPLVKPKPKPSAVQESQPPPNESPQKKRAPPPVKKKPVAEKREDNKDTKSDAT